MTISEISEKFENDAYRAKFLYSDKYQTNPKNYWKVNFIWILNLQMILKMIEKNVWKKFNRTMLFLIFPIKAYFCVYFFIGCFGLIKPEQTFFFGEII